MGTGKKVAFWGCLGCGGLIGLILLLLVGGIGFISYQGVKFGKGVGEAYNKIGVGYGELNQEFPYAPPEDGILIENRLDTALKVRSQIAEFADAKLEELEKTGKEIGKKMDGPGIMNKIHGAQQIGTIIVLAAHLAANIGDEHIRLLREEKMPASEYQWIMKTFLGNLKEIAGHEDGEAAKAWTDYLDKFDKSGKKIGDMNIDTGEGRFRSRDMNRHTLIGMLDDISAKPENTAFVKANLEKLMPNDSIGILDFFAVQLDEFSNKISAPEEVIPSDNG